jgi:hypothetical protein
MRFQQSRADPAGGCCLGSRASGPGSGSGTTLAASRILTGPASQYILYWAASIGRPARSPLIRLATRRLKVRPGSNHPPGLLSLQPESEPQKTYDNDGIHSLVILAMCWEFLLEWRIM